VPTLSTFSYAPYLTARIVSSLDQVSGGRGGWNMVTGSSDLSAQNFGLDRLPPHDQRYDMADEHTEIVTNLWDSWEPGAIVADRDNGVLIDPARVHPSTTKAVLPLARATEFRPLSAGPSDHRAGGRLRSRPHLRGPARRHHRRPPQGASRR
jgi:alkanesulfonate monooxygenase SsuD/methylene tetrahydromethanopterin reductase-like flavin-dependent oxidoreductase (luciferase family)